MQQLHRAGAILQLRALVLALDHGPCREVRQAHRRVRFVDVLATGAGRSKGIDAKIGLVDVHGFDGILFGQHGDRAGGCVDAPLRLGFRHPLNTMCTGFELQTAVHTLAFDARDDLLESAMLAGAVVQDPYPPAFVLGIASIHAVQVAREKGRLVAAGTGTDFQEHIAFVVRILRDQQRFDGLFDVG